MIIVCRVCSSPGRKTSSPAGTQVRTVPTPGTTLGVRLTEGRAINPGGSVRPQTISPRSDQLSLSDFLGVSREV
ncbi:hypothetical protein BaRGS_00003796 [Batillaria attramentaria]|uniref:Uncharacterized protein n=1 Tax=Batillaria attramentaria TaxID=370345 RepID=A0ABD0M0G3_9CAEN